MDIQLEKIELIKRLADVDSEIIIKKIKAILVPEKMNETERLLSKPELAQKIREARQEIKEGKGIKINVEDLWK